MRFNENSARRNSGPLAFTILSVNRSQETGARHVHNMSYTSTENIILTSTKSIMDTEGLLTLLYAYGKHRLCINIHHYAPPRTVLQQVASVHAAVHALRRQYTAQYREHLIR